MAGGLAIVRNVSGTATFGGSRDRAASARVCRDEFIIGEALATASIALEQLSEARQPTRNMTDMKYY